MAYDRDQATHEFTRWSESYDRSILQWLLFGPSHRALIRRIRALAGDRPARILDVGCGTGVFAARIREALPEAKVWGIDLVSDMLTKGTERWRQHAGHVQPAQADSERLPFAAGTFDVVTCANSFHHYPHQDRAIAEMHRVLRPGGRLMLIDGYRDGLWGWFIYDVCVAGVEGDVHHASSQRSASSSPRQVSAPSRRRSTAARPRSCSPRPSPPTRPRRRSSRPPLPRDRGARQPGDLDAEHPDRGLTSEAKRRGNSPIASRDPAFALGRLIAAPFARRMKAVWTSPFGLERIMMEPRRIASLKTAASFRETLERLGLGLDLPFDETVEAGASSPLGRPYHWRGGDVGNRFAILPMEGWDGLEDGKPSDLTIRRWENFGISGAKLIWGGEAVAVRPDGRANPNQLVINDANLASLAQLRERLVAAHRDRFGRTDDLYVGLQLTHSGRFARPYDKRRLEPRILYRHPCLDPKFALGSDAHVLTDDEIARLVADFVRASRQAQEAGFAFVDVKHCHGYLGHEFLSAVDRPGRYGGSLENRTRFLREIVEGIQAEAPGLEVGVRASVFDFLPYRAGADGRGEPWPWSCSETPYPYAFGGAPKTGLDLDLAEPSAFLKLLEELGVHWVCTTAGSPYYNPHIQRPSAFPPSDGYLPPEDPLIGVARQIAATAMLKARHPKLAFVGSGYTYLQDWLPHVGQRVVRDGRADFVGLGRMVLSYPDLPADVVSGRTSDRKRICRTFSDCTTARATAWSPAATPRPLLQIQARARPARPAQTRQPTRPAETQGKG